MGDLRGYSPIDQTNNHMPQYSSPFEYAMFYRIKNLIDLRNKKEEPPRSIFDSDVGYKLRSSANYRLNLIFYHPKRPSREVRRSKIVAQFSSSSISGVSATEIPLNFRYDRRHIDFVTSQEFQDAWASISLKVEQPKSEKDDEKTQVVTPKPALLLHIVVSRWAQVMVIMLFAIFTALSSLNILLAQLLISLFPFLKNNKDAISVMLAGLGTIGTTFILFRLYRKLK